MIMGLNQPYFMPYIGHWQLINAVDIFIIGDDYNYINRGWINRNRILLNGEAKFFNIEIAHASQNKKINELYLSDVFDPDKKLQLIKQAYSAAPYFQEGFALMCKILKHDQRNLADFLEYSIRCVCSYLGITTKLIRSSSIPGNSELKREYRIFDQCNYVGADTYINAICGRELYDFEAFRQRDLQLGFIQSSTTPYKQFGEDFIPNLSLIDVIMFNSKEEIQELLNQFSIIKDI